MGTGIFQKLACKQTEKMEIEKNNKNREIFKINKNSSLEKISNGNIIQINDSKEVIVGITDCDLYTLERRTHDKNIYLYERWLRNFRIIGSHNPILVDKYEKGNESYKIYDKMLKERGI